MDLCAICKLNLTVWRGQKASIKEQKGKRAEIKMIVWNNGARYLARSSVQWAKKRGVPHCVKWNRTVWSAESKVNTQNCCVYFWIGLFVFHLPRVVSRIGKPKKKLLVGIEDRKIGEVAWRSYEMLSAPSKACIRLFGFSCLDCAVL